MAKSTAEDIAPAAATSRIAGFSTAAPSRAQLSDYAGVLAKIAEYGQPSASAFMVPPTPPPRHKSADPDNDPVWPLKAAPPALKYVLDELAAGRLVRSAYTFEHHREASLGLPPLVDVPGEREISYVFDDKRMAALWFVPVDAAGAPARDQFVGLFYPTRMCQGPMDNCHGGSTYTFLDAVATMLAGHWLTSGGRNRGKLPYLSSASHENVYKDGVPLGTVSSWRAAITQVEHSGDATILTISSRINQRTDPTGASEKFAVEGKTTIRIPFSSLALPAIPASLPPLEDRAFASLASRQPELNYMPRAHLSLLAPLIRGTYQALRLPERSNRSERYFREEFPEGRRVYGIYFLGRPQAPAAPGDGGVGDLRPGGEICGLVWFHPHRAGSGSGAASHGAIGAFIDSTYGMLINTLLLASVGKKEKATLATHQWNFRTLTLRLDFAAEARTDDASRGVKMFRCFVKRVEGGGRKTVFGGRVYDIPSGEAAAPDRAGFIDERLVPIVDSESLFVDASKKYGGRPIGWGTGETAVESKNGDDGFETGEAVPGKL